MTKKIKRNLILKIKGNLILEKDTKFEESIEVEGSITGYYNLTIIGNITAGNINARDIDAWDITAGNQIFCEAIKAKKKIRTRSLIENRSQLEMKEW